MIKFLSITITRIKGFNEKFPANFSKEKNLYTVSGANGSGKSTVLRSLVLAQKAFFLTQLDQGSELYKRYWGRVDDEIRRYVRDDKSSICVNFSINGSEGQLVLSGDVIKGWTVSGTKLEELKKFWDIKNPTSIILYLDASKSVSEEEIRYTSLNMSDLGIETLAIRCIFTPQHAFSEMYRQTIQDYIVERLSPSSPPRTVYQSIAKSIFHELLGGVAIANFSARLDQQVTLLARRILPQKSGSFDIRELSSGEKTLYFTLSYLFLANTVGCLIIDEPENHFHEDLLIKFVKFLGNILGAGSLAEYLKMTGLINVGEDSAEGNVEPGIVQKQKIAKKTEDYYSKHKLSQVFLLTHSKTLIYHAFSIGKNYVIRNQGKKHEWALLAEVSAESTLRELGLSSTLHKILFVEGKSDSALLSHALAASNVILRPLDGSGAVKDMFRRLHEIRSEVKGISFGFLIDSDDKAPGYIDQLRKINPHFFDSCFCLLKTHEIENLLLDAKVFSKTIDAERSTLVTTPLPTAEEIQAKLVEFGKRGIFTSFKKAVNSQIEMDVLSLLAPKIWGNKSLKYEDTTELNSSLNVVLPAGLEVELKSIIANSAEKAKERFFDISDTELLARCDGKQALSLAASYFAAFCKVDKDRFLQQLYATAINDKTTELGKVVERLEEIFSK